MNLAELSGLVDQGCRFDRLPGFMILYNDASANAHVADVDLEDRASKTAAPQRPRRVISSPQHGRTVGRIRDKPSSEQHPVRVTAPGWIVN